jgi:peptidyl-tRNA hydrolase
MRYAAARAAKPAIAACALRDSLKLKIGQSCIMPASSVRSTDGTLAFKKGGGLAGHNGLKSIAQCLGTDQFGRMRVGIGRPVHGSVANYVLSPFSKEEQVQLPLLLEKLHDPMLSCVVEGINKVGIYNKKNLLA